MTAVTLSTLAYRSLVIEECIPAAGGGRRGGEAGRCVSVVTGRGAKVSDPHAARDPEPSARPARGPWATELDAMEHRARGLLNLTALLSRCLDGGGGSAAERTEWRAQVAEANERLEVLYQSGLPRTFLSEPPARSGGPRPAPGVAGQGAREEAHRERVTPGGGAA